MASARFWKTLLGLCALTGGLSWVKAGEPALPAKIDVDIDFETQVRPLLSGRCFPCHSAEEQKGGLSLADRKGLIAGGDSGAAIDLTAAENSLLLEKVTGADPAGIMPPRGKGKTLTVAEVQTLQNWLAQGAKWEGSAITTESAARSAAENHWAFQVPVPQVVPNVERKDWPSNPVDSFVLARLERERLQPAPQANKRTLLRRLSLDLIGLPPTPEEIAAFEADTQPDAYERQVDRLMDSPRYGERWARRWLDLARYADTNGFEKDRDRPIWPYRNWVINAFNSDQPFDQFTIEQVAGDMLPGATVDQMIATGYHRNTMTNEEGGIDVEEFRFASVVDRVANTGTTWLGLTLACAQCHNHKYDPITQSEYYQLMAMLDNADEPEMGIPDQVRDDRIAEVERKIAEKTAELPLRFPAGDPDEGWQVLKPVSATAAAFPGVKLTSREDGSILVSGDSPDKVTYTVELTTNQTELQALKLEVLADPALPSKGPGRTPHGNFVLTCVKVAVAPLEGGTPAPVALASAKADIQQPKFEPAGVLDSDDSSGWAIDDGTGNLNSNHVLSLAPTSPVSLPSSPEGMRVFVTLEQNYGGRHTLGAFRISGKADLPSTIATQDLPEAERRSKSLEIALSAWEQAIHPARWWVVRPATMLSRKGATLEVLADGSVLVSGDKPNNDVTEVELELPANIGRLTALRLEVLPHESHPSNGPGRAPLFSEGDFILTEVEATLIPAGNSAGARPITFKEATADHSEGGKPAQLTIDGKQDTGWSIRGEVGKPHQAVFTVSDGVDFKPGDRLKLVLHQSGIHQMTIGRFRISLTSQGGEVRTAGVPADVEEALLTPAPERTSQQNALVKGQFLQVAPQLVQARAEIQQLRKSAPGRVPTLVMQERRPEHHRVTRIHERGEFLKPGASVEPGVPAVLHSMENSAPPNRLELARWLVDSRNPLTARVIVNREWQALWGRGLVATVEDFGTRGERPSHPELLDWLALEFQHSGWSRKHLHRLMVTSSTYKQNSTVTPELLERDPRNELLARGARFRVDAEVVRDVALSAAGLLDQRLGGPSVYPPQPEAATSLAYNGSWPTSQGRDRYRRGLYTFVKRTAPYAAGITFDGPTSDTTCARRDRSNTPLQALTLLNDSVFVEAARELAKRVMRETPVEPSARIERMFQLCLGRPAEPRELLALQPFLQVQTARLERGELDAAGLAGGTAPGVEPRELAAWTTVARVVLNLDETLNRE